MRNIIAVIAFGILTLVSSLAFAEARFTSDVVGDFTVNNTLTVNGNVDIVLDATGQVSIDAATTTNTNVMGALYLDWKGSTANSGALIVEAEAEADIALTGVESLVTGFVGGSTSAMSSYHAIMIGDDDDGLGAVYVGFAANDFVANGGTSFAFGASVGLNYGVALYANSGDIWFNDYAATIEAMRITAGAGDVLTIHGGDGLQTAAEDRAGGPLRLYGGEGKGGTGVDGDVILAYTGAAIQGMVGIGNDTPAELLEVSGNILISNAGGDSNSYKLVLTSHLTAGDETQTSSLFNAFGADPYLVIAAPSATGVETNVLHIDSTSFRMATDDVTDIGKTGGNRPKDIFLSGNLDAENGSVSANTTLSAGTTVTAGTNVTATAGDVTDQYANVRRIQPLVAATAVLEPFVCAVGVRGWMIQVDDTDDGGSDWICACIKSDDTDYEWKKIDDLSVTCFP